MDCTFMLRVCVAYTGVQDWYLSPCVCEDGNAHYDKMFEESVAAGVINNDGSLRAEHPASSKAKEVKAEVTKTSRGPGKKRKAENAVEVDDVVEEG